jgi:Mce-associated membrane protein
VISCFSVHDPEGPEAGRCDEPADGVDPDELRSHSAVDSGSVVPTSETDPADEVAEAEAHAEAARARLARLRRTAGTGDADEGSESPAAERQPAKSIRTRLRLRRPGRPRWLRRPGRKTIAVGAGLVLASASLSASGYMLWQHHAAVHKRQLAAEFSAAARQGITAFMSIDPDHAKDSVQRMIDYSTGDQKNQLSVLSILIVQKAEETNVGSKVSVEATAVESLSDNSGVVLVAAKTAPFGPDNVKPPPALFRLSVNLDRDDGQLKMSKVEFLP